MNVLVYDIEARYEDLPPNQIVIGPFETEEIATNYAISLLVETGVITIMDGKFHVGDEHFDISEDALECFQEGLGVYEYFHTRDLKKPTDPCIQRRKD